MEKKIYMNSLANFADSEDWVAEGHIKKSVTELGTVLSNADSLEMGDHANWTYWLPEDFPSDIRIEWDFKPLREPGLCMIFFSAEGRQGESLFDPSLLPRDGNYPQYHSGDINAYHISYFRHKQESERSFRTCNLRKSFGFNFAVQGADPLPPVEDVHGFYHIVMSKFHGMISFTINNLKIFEWQDDGKEFGPVLGSGKIGFRQMAPMKAAYKNLEVYELS